MTEEQYNDKRIMNIRDRIPEVPGIDRDGREIKASDYHGRKTIILHTSNLVDGVGVIENINNINNNILCL